jgi:hypothetical protein
MWINNTFDFNGLPVCLDDAVLNIKIWLQYTKFESVPIALTHFYLTVLITLKTYRTVLLDPKCDLFIYFHKPAKNVSFLGTYSKLRKVTISFVISILPPVRLSVRMEQFGSYWTDFHEIWYFSFFLKTAKKILHTHTHTHTHHCIIFIALPLQQWLLERTSVLRYTYISCLVFQYFATYAGDAREIRVG